MCNTNLKDAMKHIAISNLKQYAEEHDLRQMQPLALISIITEQIRVAHEDLFAKENDDDNILMIILSVLEGNPEKLSIKNPTKAKSSIEVLINIFEAIRNLFDEKKDCNIVNYLNNNIIFLKS